MRIAVTDLAFAVALAQVIACSPSPPASQPPPDSAPEEQSPDAARPMVDASRDSAADTQRPPAPDAGGTEALPPDAAPGVVVDAAPDAPPAAPDTGDTAPAITVGAAGGICVPGASYGDPLPQNRTATLVRNLGGGLLEGPAWVAAQKALYFTEVNGIDGGRLHKYTPANNQFTVFAEKVGVGGLALDSQGMLVASAHDKQRISRFDPATGQRTDVEGGSMYMGKPFNQCNDVVVRADGNMYFSDPTYQLAGRQGQGVMAFYRLSPAGVVTRITVATNPNGVAISPDGKWLYLATTGGEALERFVLAADGTVMGAGSNLINTSSDGMAVDCAGNLYLSTGGQIRVHSPSGQLLGSIGGLTAGSVTNSAFGGEDGKTLYITTSQALYQIRLNVPGFPN